jgi:hypothetical protein
VDDTLTDAGARTGNSELIAASLLTGVFGAATIYISEAVLGPVAFAPLAQLWTLWALFAASITFGVQQWVIKLLLGGVAGRSIARAGSAPLVATAALVLAICFAMRAQWFDDRLVFVLMAVGLVFGTAANGAGRGAIAAAGSTRVLAIIVIGENLIRILLLIPLIILDADAAWFGLALLAGFGINMLVPRTVRGRSQVVDVDPDAVGPSTTPMLIAAIVGLVGFATMFAGPLLLAAGGGTATEVSAYFLIVTLARVPFVAVLGLLPKIAARLETSAAAGDMTALRKWQMRVITGSVIAAVVVAVVAGLTADLVFGRILDTSEVAGNVVYALVGAASMLALASLSMTMLQLALARYRLLAVAWSVPVIAGAVALAAGWLQTIEAMSWWLFVVEVAVLMILSIAAIAPQVSSSLARREPDGARRP